MNRKILWLMVSGLMALSLVIAACGPAAVEEKKPAPAAEEKKPAPVVEKKQEVVEKEAVASQGEMVKVTLTKLDGTKVDKLVEKPKYGGAFNRLLTQSNEWNPQTLRAGATSDVLALEKLLVGDYARGPLGTGEVSWDIYEYLSMNHFRGNLAESWEMPDDTTIIYHIRRGVHWALDDKEASKLVNGREVTAEDVVFSFKWLVFREPPTIVRGYFAASKLSDIYATDKYTVVLKAPKADLANALGYLSDLIVIVPREVIEKYGTFNNWRQVVGTGPFIIKDFVPGSVATWVKNPNYWGYDPVLGKDYPLPYADSIRHLDIPDISTRQAALRTGKIDDAVTLRRDEVEPMLKTAPHLKVKTVAFGTGSNRIALQMNNKAAPWQDVRVRRALLMAINHQEMVDAFWNGAADIQAFPLPGAPELYDMGWAVPMKELPRETQELFEYHPDKAKQLLKEAGYPNGFKTSIMVLASNVDELAIVKNYWAKIGVDLTLDVKEVGVHARYSRELNYPEMITAGRWGTATLYAKYETPPASNNEGNVNDPQIQKLRREMFEVLWDTEKRTPIMKELYLYSLSQAYYLPMPSDWGYRVYQPWLRNYDAESSIGYWGKSFPYVWLDLDLKKKLGY